ncbi:MAG TPA: hypothetical protein P5137_07940 [Candidatus Brocadiia bacterium]|nr:hypothetical protein [Candidatus Brocadiia bacterium]
MAAVLVAAMWWNPSWRYRTTVEAPSPRALSGARPIEAAVDFSLLLEKAGVRERFEPGSVRVVDRKANAEVPYEWRQEFNPETGRHAAVLAWTGASDLYDIYFDTEGRGHKPPAYAPASLPPANLLANPGFEQADGSLPAAWKVKPAELASLASHKLSEGRQSLRLVVDDKTPSSVSRAFSVRQTVDVRAFAGRDMVFECDMLAERAEYGAPSLVELRQFRADGSALPNFAVHPRFLMIELAQGQFVQLRERGRFHRDAATCEVSIHFRLNVIDADTRGGVGGPEGAFTVWLDRVVLRPVERWPWPGASRAGFAPGAFAGPHNASFEFTGQRRVAFNGASDACVSTGRYNATPGATHWGVTAGTIDFWIKPAWDAGDGKQHILFDAKAYMHRLQSSVRKMSNGDLEFLIVDSAEKTHVVRAKAPFKAGQWSHVAATWDHARASLQLFVDGKRLAVLGPEAKPWPASPTPESKMDVKGMGVDDGDKRTVPMQAFIGGDHRFRSDISAEAAMDDFRVSDVVRYTADFTPPASPAVVDEHTRALFPFDGGFDGVHAGDDQYVHGHPACELQPRRETANLDVLGANGAVEARVVKVCPYPAPEVFEANRAETRLPVTRPFTPPPDPRFVEYRERQAKLSTASPAAIDVQGDYAPWMRTLTFDAPAKPLLLPRWRANDNVVPYSVASLRETLATGIADDAEKAIRIMKYANETTNYYDGGYCESLPTLHRPRTSYTLIKALNIYPFDQCGPLNHTLRKMFLAAGISSTNESGTHHQFGQAFYKGQHRLFDLSSRVYWLRRDDVHVTSRRGLEDDLWLKLRQGGDPNAWFPGRFSAATFGQAERPHSMDFPVRPGERVAFSWQNEGRWFELVRQREPITLARIPPMFGNGVIVFEPAQGGPIALDNIKLQTGANGPELTAIDPAKPSSVTYDAACPYIFTDAHLAAAWAAPASVEAAVTISFDNGAKWVDVWRGAGAQNQMNVNLRNQVSARYAYKLRIAFTPGAVTLSGLNVRSVFAASPFVHPETLRLGANKLALYGAQPAAPVQATLRWVERHKTDLGLVTNAISFYLDSDRTLRNVFVAAPGQPIEVSATIFGRAASGRLSVENPRGGLLGAETTLAAPNAEPATASVAVTPVFTRPADIAVLDIAFTEKGVSRRIKAQVLAAVSPLVSEAEAGTLSGKAEVAGLADASGARIVNFKAKGQAAYDLKPGQPGKHALWVRARWDKGARAAFTLQVDGAKPREVRANAMIGFSDWDKPAQASTKMFAHFGEQYAHWSWYRVPDVEIKPGAAKLTLSAEAGAAFDALMLLPQTPEMDRAAMNLFQNWNYAPWDNSL